MEIWDSILNAALNMSLLEIIAVFFGVLSVWFSKKENILVYPTGIISVLLYVYLCFDFGLYADAGINVFYFVMSIYGWYNWSRQIKNKTLEISRNSFPENIIYSICVGALWLIMYLILSKYTDSTVAYLDSLTTAICIIGMLLMALKKIENWIYWITANLISIPLYWYKGLPLSSIQFLLFTVIAISGYLEWNRKLKKI